MSNEQEPKLEAVRTAIRAANKSLLELVKNEPGRTAESIPLPIASGLRLAYALGQMTDEQRDALLVGAELSDDQRELVVGLLTEINESASPR